MQNRDNLKELYLAQSDDNNINKDSKIKPNSNGSFGRHFRLFFITLFVIGCIVTVPVLYYTGAIRLNPSSDPCGAIEPSEKGEFSDEAAKAIGQCPPPRIVELALAIQTTSPGKALAMLEVAVQRNYGPAARLIGEMYDPRFWNENTSPFKQPDARNAIKWYNKAIALNDATVQERLQQLQLEHGP